MDTNTPLDNLACEKVDKEKSLMPNEPSGGSFFRSFWFYRHETVFGPSNKAPSISGLTKERTGLEIRKETSDVLNTAADATGYPKWFIGWAALYWGLLPEGFCDRWNAPAERTEMLILGFDRTIRKPVHARTNLTLPKNDPIWKTAVDEAAKAYGLRKWQVAEACIYAFLDSADLYNIIIKPDLTYSPA